MLTPLQKLQQARLKLALRQLKREIGLTLRHYKSMRPSIALRCIERLTDMLKSHRAQF